MFCQTCRKHISAYLDGELTPREAGRLEGHLARCPACAEVLRQYERLRGGLAAVPSPEVRADAWARLRTEASRRTAPQPRLREPWWQPIQRRVLVPTGALAVLLLGLLWAWQVRPPSQVDGGPSGREIATQRAETAEPEEEGRRERGREGTEEETGKQGDREIRISDTSGTLGTSEGTPSRTTGGVATGGSQAPPVVIATAPRPRAGTASGARQPTGRASRITDHVSRLALAAAPSASAVALQSAEAPSPARIETKPVPPATTPPLEPRPAEVPAETVAIAGPLAPPSAVAGRPVPPVPPRRASEGPAAEERLLAMAPPPAPYAGSTSVPLLGDLPFVGSLFRSRSLGSEAGEAGYHFISDSSSGHTERRSVSDAARGLTIETEEEERTTDGLEIASASITVTEAQPVPDPETGELTYVITRRPMATVRIAEVPAHAGR